MVNVSVATVVKLVTGGSVKLCHASASIQTIRESLGLSVLTWR